MFYLGTITAASGAYSNQNAGNSGLGTFVIPRSAKALCLVPSTSGLMFELMNATSPTGGHATGSAFQTTAARAAFIKDGEINGPFRTIGGPEHIVSVWNAAGGFLSVRVYVVPTS
jgi:hypothetical protein